MKCLHGHFSPSTLSDPAVVLRLLTVKNNGRNGYRPFSRCRLIIVKIMVNNCDYYDPNRNWLGGGKVAIVGMVREGTCPMSNDHISV